MNKDNFEKSFIQHIINGIYLNFPNGNAISTVWGSGSYSENYDSWINNSGKLSIVEQFNKFMGSDNVEIMIIKCPEKLKKKIHKKYSDDNDNSVIGYLNITQWLEIINLLAK